MTNKDAYYFSHDSNALTDPKILSMRCDYGLEGYGLYWAILEMLRNESTYKLPLNKNTYRAIKMQTGTTIDVEKYIDDCINEYKDNEKGNGLFVRKNGLFWSESFLRRMQKYENLKEKRRQAANARWGNEEENKQPKSENTKNEETQGKQEKNAKLCKSMKKLCKCNTSAHQKRYTCNAKSQKVYAKLCKLNEIKLNKIKLNNNKSICQSINNNINNNSPKKNDRLTDEMEKAELDYTISKCGLNALEPRLAEEIKGALQEMFMDKRTRSSVLKMDSKRLQYALHKYSVANTKKEIANPKAYFKTCVLTAIAQAELSTQYDLDEIYKRMESD